MQKIFEGNVVSVKMQKTVIVAIERKTAHSIYKKLMRKSKNIKADTGVLSVTVGSRVKIIATRPISKDKHFKILEVIKNDSA